METWGHFLTFKGCFHISGISQVLLVHFGLILDTGGFLKTFLCNTYVFLVEKLENIDTKKKNVIPVTRHF